MELMSLVADPDAVKAFAKFLGDGPFVMQMHALCDYDAAPRGVVLQQERVNNPVADPDWFLHKVGQASLVPPGHGRDTLVLYCTTNPVDMRRTNVVTAKQIVDGLAATAAPPLSGKPLSADSLWFHNAPKTMSEQRWLTLGVDVKDAVGRVLDMLGSHGVDVIRAVETRDGYRLFVDASTFKSSASLIDSLKSDTYVHVAPDGKESVEKVCSFPHNAMCPVPGTWQGGFVVRFAELGVVVSGSG